MENVQEFKLKTNTQTKLYSNIEMYKKMFYLMLNHSIDDAEKEIREGKVVDFNDFIYELNKEFGV